MVGVSVVGGWVGGSVAGAWVEGTWVVGVEMVGACVVELSKSRVVEDREVEARVVVDVSDTRSANGTTSIGACSPVGSAKAFAPAANPAKLHARTADAHSQILFLSQYGR